MKGNGLSQVAGWLIVVGGLNWGLVGFFGYNVVDSIFGAGSLLTNVVYDLVGLSALYMGWMMVGKK